MKNSTLFILLAGIFILFSCGTTNRASYASSEFRNGIYYAPDENDVQTYAKSQNELDQLQNATSATLKNTSKGNSYPSQTGVETIYVGDTNVVNIDYNPGITYSIMDDDESFEARLTKFDSPTYTINIEWNDPWYNPWWGTWYRPYGITWGTGWYNPWWGNYYTWWGPRYNHWYGWGGWYDPWWGGSGWYDPWWGPSWYPGWGPGYYPPYRPGHGHGRDIYYGKRESGPSYNNHGNRAPNRGSSYTRRDPSMSPIRGNNSNNTYNPANRPNNGSSTGGSIYRRGGNASHNGAIYNNSASNTGTTRPGNSGTTTNTGGSMYRRSTTSNTRNAQTSTNSRSEYNNSSTRNNSSSYNRSNSNTSTYNSGSYSRSSNASTSSGTSSGSSSSGSGARSGGSSYRR